MALPALLGVGFLAGLFGNLFAEAVSFFTKKVGKKIALRIVFGVVVAGMMLTLVGVCQALISGFTFVLPDQYTMILKNVLPDNTNDCLAAIITATVSRRLYDLKVKQAVNLWTGV